MLVVPCITVFHQVQLILILIYHENELKAIVIKFQTLFHPCIPGHKEKSNALNLELKGSPLSHLGQQPRSLIRLFSTDSIGWIAA